MPEQVPLAAEFVRKWVLVRTFSLFKQNLFQVKYTSSNICTEKLLLEALMAQIKNKWLCESIVWKINEFPVPILRQYYVKVV